MSRSFLSSNLILTHNNKSDVLSALMWMAQGDADFCGDNGYDYLWESAKGFECNAEYVLSIAEKEPTIRAMIEKFVDMWMGTDGYYADYEVHIEEMDNIIAISVAYITD